MKTYDRFMARRLMRLTVPEGGPVEPPAPAAAQPRPLDKANARALEAAERTREKVRDRRRFKVAPVPTGESRVAVDPSETRTMFKNRVRAPQPGDRVLSDGRNSVKLGGDVMVGELKGARLFYLSLEERRSCPASCGFWTTCYGNNMSMATRWDHHAPGFLEILRDDIRRVCDENEHVLIRLHMLGDFYSVAYVRFWENQLLVRHNLHIFGFTAHQAGTPIGDEIAKTRIAHPKRFRMRNSGIAGMNGSFTIDFPTEKKMLGNAVVCPEQRDAMDGGERRMHCAACGACFYSSTPIAFVEH